MVILEGVKDDVIVTDYHLEKHLLSVISYDSNSLDAKYIIRIINKFPNLLFFKSPKLNYFRDVIRTCIADPDFETLLNKLGDVVNNNEYWLLTGFHCVYSYGHEVQKYDVMITPLTDLKDSAEVLSVLRYYSLSDILTQI